MASVQQQVESVQRYVAACKQSLTPEAFAGVASEQCLQLQQLFRRQSFDTDSAAAVLRQVTSCSLWSSQDKRSLADSVAAAVSVAVTAKTLQVDNSSRRKLQDYSDFSCYLPEHVWAFLSNPEKSTASKLVDLSAFLVRLGLRSPTETTSQAVAALVLQLPAAERRGATYADYHETFLVCKEYLRRATCNAPDRGAAYPHVVVLPSNWRQHSQLWLQEALGQDTPSATARVSLELLRALQASIPMRKTNRHLQATGTAGSDLLTLLFAQMQRQLPAPTQRSVPGGQLALPMLPTSTQLPCLPTQLPLQERDRAACLALTDGSLADLGMQATAATQPAAWGMQPTAATQPAAEATPVSNAAAAGALAVQSCTVQPPSSTLSPSVQTRPLASVREVTSTSSTSDQGCSMLSAAEALRREMAGEPAVLRRKRSKTSDPYYKPSLAQTFEEEQQEADAVELERKAPEQNSKKAKKAKKEQKVKNSTKKKGKNTKKSKKAGSKRGTKAASCPETALKNEASNAYHQARRQAWSEDPEDLETATHKARLAHRAVYARAKAAAAAAGGA